MLNSQHLGAAEGILEGNGGILGLGAWPPTQWLLRGLFSFCPRPVSLRLDLGCWKLEGRGFCPQLEQGGSCVVAPSHLILEGHPLALA